MELSSTDELAASVDRKILQTGGATDPGWINYPERAFEDDCGAIKIGPTVQGKASFYGSPHIWALLGFIYQRDDFDQYL